MKSFVSIIVPAFNEEVHIRECLESLLAQTHQPREILVADDGSSDGTAEVVTAIEGVTLLRLPHRGKGPSVNAAVKRAKGDILVFADADLVYDDGYVEALVRPIIAGECAGTSHATEYVANHENRWSKCLQFQFGLPPELRLRLTDAQVSSGSPIFRAIRTEDFLRAQGFDDTGFTDDGTLAPKLGFHAKLVREAVCRHYNPESLREIFGRGRWAGKSVYLAHGPKALARHLPPFTLARSLGAARKSRMWEMIPFQFAEDLGIVSGVLENTASRVWRRHEPR